MHTISPDGYCISRGISLPLAMALGALCVLRPRRYGSAILYLTA